MNLTLGSRFNLIARNGDKVTQNVVLFKDEPMQASISAYIPLAVTAASLPLWENAPIIAPTHLKPQEAARNIFGHLSNPTVDGDKFTAAATVDLSLLGEKYPQLHQRLVNGEAVNGSVDIEVIAIKANGNYKGVDFEYFITEIVAVNNYAILQDTLGACSVHQGCGFNVSATNTKEEVDMTNESDGILSEVKGILMELKAAKDERPEKLEVTHIKECEFNDLMGRLSSTEEKLATTQETVANLQAGYTALKGSYAEVTEENKQLKASLNQLKNNQNGTGVKAEGEPQNTLPEYVV
jgi:molybdopterin converting factor small subunit